MYWTAKRNFVCVCVRLMTKLSLNGRGIHNRMIKENISGTHIVAKQYMPPFPFVAFVRKSTADRSIV